MIPRRFRFRGEPLILNDAVRASLPGQFIALPDGITHYELRGAAENPCVVLIHGFSTPYFIWDHTIGALADAGLRVLRYDLYGRGYSDRPEIPYNADLFDRQLFDLLKALQIDRPVHLIGLSMGGTIAAVFADRHPAMVDTLGLIDPALALEKRAWKTRLLDIPLLGEWLMNTYGDAALVKGLSKDFLRPERFPEYSQKYREQMQYQGFKQAILSTVRGEMLRDMSEAYQRVGRQNRRVILIWGREDQTIPFSVSENVRAFIPHAVFHAIDDAGHIPHYEKPEQVNPLLIEFLNAH